MTTKKSVALGLYEVPHPALEVPHTVFEDVALRPKCGTCVALQNSKCHVTFPRKTAIILSFVALGQINNKLRVMKKGSYPQAKEAKTQNSRTTWKTRATCHASHIFG